MSLPRRPRGEKPATTIQWQRRQIITMEQQIAALRLACADKEKVIAGYDVQLSEAQDTTHRIAESAIARRESMATQLAAARVDSARLAFLEGYYAKSQETAPPTWTIPAPRSHLARDQTETYARERAGNPEDLQTGRQAPQGAGVDHGAARSDAGPGDEIRRQRFGHQAHPDRRTVEHIEITEQMKRHQRPDWNNF